MTIEFGTDGIRGKAGRHPLTPNAIEQIGNAIGHLLEAEKKHVIVGRDTRESGLWIEKALVKGLQSCGATVVLGGIMPTAAVSCLVAATPKAIVGIMITASHNPHEDNGLKFFGEDGRKLTDAKQQKLVASIGTPPPYTEGMSTKHLNPLRAWRNQLPQVDLNGIKILFDGANGSGAFCGPEALRQMGAEVKTIGCVPNGSNINDLVGALHPPTDLLGCDIGICLDGDADRIMMVDPNHGIIDGDDILWLLKDHFNGPLVGTIMSNGGLEQALNGRLMRSQVGDRHVATLMVQSNAALGAEPSGHVLFDKGMPTGDGLYTALMVLKAAGRPPFDLSGFKRWPVKKLNLKFDGFKPDLGCLSSPIQAKNDGQRVIVRYSGTESKLRILVEGSKAEQWTERIAHEFRGLLS